MLDTLPHPRSPRQTGIFARQGLNAPEGCRATPDLEPNCSPSGNFVTPRDGKAVRTAGAVEAERRAFHAKNSSHRHRPRSTTTKDLSITLRSLFYFVIDWRVGGSDEDDLDDDRASHRVRRPDRPRLLALLRSRRSHHLPNRRLHPLRPPIPLPRRPPLHPPRIHGAHLRQPFQVARFHQRRFEEGVRGEVL